MNYWLIDANTHVLSPLITTNVGVVKPNIVTTNFETNAAIQAIDTYLSTTIALVFMEPYALDDLMRFTASVSLNGLTTKTNYGIDTPVALSFVNKKLLWPTVSTKIVRLLLSWL
jgi:hypothetical protein